MASRPAASIPESVQYQKSTPPGHGRRCSGSRPGVPESAASIVHERLGVARSICRCRRRRGFAGDRRATLRCRGTGQSQPRERQQLQSRRAPAPVEPDASRPACWRQTTVSARTAGGLAQAASLPDLEPIPPHRHTVPHRLVSAPQPRVPQRSSRRCRTPASGCRSCREGLRRARCS